MIPRNVVGRCEYCGRLIRLLDDAYITMMAEGMPCRWKKVQEWWQRVPNKIKLYFCDNEHKRLWWRELRDDNPSYQIIDKRDFLDESRKGGDK